MSARPSCGWTRLDISLDGYGAVWIRKARTPRQPRIKFTPMAALSQGKPTRKDKLNRAMRLMENQPFSRRGLATLRALSGLTRPHKVAAWYGKLVTQTQNPAIRQMLQSAK